MCDGCAESVTEALSAAPAVADVKVSLEEKKVSVFVTCDTMMDGLAMMPELVEAVKGAGFEAEPDFERRQSRARSRPRPRPQATRAKIVQEGVFRARA